VCASASPCLAVAMYGTLVNRHTHIHTRAPFGQLLGIYDKLHYLEEKVVFKFLVRVLIVYCDLLISRGLCVKDYQESRK